MSPKELSKFFDPEIINSADLNPLALAEFEQIGQRETPIMLRDEGNRQQRAIAKVVGNQLPFYSTFNTLFTLFGLYVKVTCPYCTNPDTIVRQGSGNSETLIIHYDCPKCHGILSFKMDHDGMGGERDQ